MTGDHIDSFAVLEESAGARLALMQNLADDLRAIRVRHTDPRGAVTVVVDGAGGLLDIVLTESISQLSPDDFTRTVLETAAAAAHLALARRGEVIAEFNDQVNN